MYHIYSPASLQSLPKRNCPPLRDKVVLPLNYPDTISADGTPSSALAQCQVPHWRNAKFRIFRVISVLVTVISTAEETQANSGLPQTRNCEASPSCLVSRIMKVPYV